MLRCMCVCCFCALVVVGETLALGLCFWDTLVASGSCPLGEGSVYLQRAPNPPKFAQPRLSRAKWHRSKHTQICSLTWVWPSPKTQTHPKLYLVAGDERSLDLLKQECANLGGFGARCYVSSCCPSFLLACRVRVCPLTPLRIIFRNLWGILRSPNFQERKTVSRNCPWNS